MIFSASPDIINLYLLFFFTQFDKNNHLLTKIFCTIIRILFCEIFFFFSNSVKNNRTMMYLVSNYFEVSNEVSNYFEKENFLIFSNKKKYNKTLVNPFIKIIFCIFLSRYLCSSSSSSTAECRENHFALLWSSQNWAAA
uniref:Uncharacterized protein n=1 Tax=Cacopsylla melanoneura TaxID=428564 RepID=A0A8D8LSG8_9HEMI